MADFKVKYPADTTALTATGWASLASSSGFTAGYALASVSNRTNLDITHLLSVGITVGTTPTINTYIQLFLLVARGFASGSPTWPAPFSSAYSGSAGAFTLNSLGTGYGAMIPLKTWNVDSTTSNRIYEASELDIAAFCGGNMPNDWALWLVHNTGVNLNATGGNFYAEYTRVQYQSV